MIKTISHNLSNISDAQGILKKVLAKKSTDLNEILKKYGNILVKKKVPPKTLASNDEVNKQESIVEDLFQMTTSKEATENQAEQEIILEFFNEDSETFDNIMPEETETPLEKPEQGSFSCIKCQRFFKEYTALEHHLKESNYCRTSDFFSCRKCEMTFKSRKQYQNHKKIHTTVRKHECNQCQKNYSSEFNLQNHKSTAHGYNNDLQFESTYRCCNSQYKTKQELATHVKNHSKTDFLCQICKKVLHSKYSYQVHSKIHKRFKCSFCGGFFDSKIKLERHLYLHKTYGIDIVEDVVIQDT